MRKLCVLVSLFMFVSLSAAYAATTITPQIPGQWLATGQLNMDNQLVAFEVTSTGLPYQIYSNITDNDALDTIMALYDMGGNLFDVADDSSNWNPSFSTWFPVGETYLLKFGLYDGFDDPDFSRVTEIFAPYDFTLAFVNALPVEVDASFAAVPAPSALWLLGSGLIGLVGLRRKK